LDVFQFLDYRDFMRESYEHRKREKSSTSYRSLARWMEMDPGQLHKIHHKRLHLSMQAVPRACKVLRLEGDAAAFFELLVRCGRSSDQILSRSLACPCDGQV